MTDDAGQQSGATSDADSQRDSGDKSTPDSSGAGRSFTQEEVDSIVGAKVSAKLKQFGDLGELKNKAEQFDKLQDSQRTETEKLSSKLAEAERKNLDFEQRYQSLLATRAIEKAAKDFVDPDAAARLIDTSLLEYDEDGLPKTDSVTKALEDLATKRPYLKSATRTQGSADGGSRGDAASGGRDMESLLRAAAKG